jgi:hypothetical protein
MIKQNQNRNNIYDDNIITIMDIYSLIYYFDECSTTVSNHHQNCSCLCKDKFTENINDEYKYKDIKENIINHYSKLEEIDKKYSNYKEYIIDSLKNNKFEYNIYHKITFHDNDNFDISNIFNLIASSDDYVIDFIFTPQLTNLNLNKILLTGIINNFLLKNIYKNSSEKNLNKYANKTIHTCILTLDTLKPIFIELNIDKNCQIIINLIKEYLKDKYKNNHELLYLFFKYCKENKPISKSSIEYTYEKITEKKPEFPKLLKYEFMPKYIINFFEDYNKQYNKYKRIDTTKKMEIEKIFDVNKSLSFIEELNKYLDDAIDNYFDELNNEDVIDF